MIKSKFSVVVSVSLVALVIFAASFWAWWHYIYSEPAQVFDRMLSTMLTTPSVTKSISQEEGEQTLDQVVQLTTQPTQQVHASNVLDQGGSVITTESFSTAETDFVRYTSIETDQKNSSGNSFDFSSVLNVWGKSATDEQTGQQAQLFNQTVLGVVPTANLPVAERQKLIDQIKQEKVYSVDYSSVSRTTENGRPTYTYDVTVAPVAYINMLKTFAASLGLTELEQVDPSQYANTPPLKFSFSIDVWTAQLTKVDYVDSNRSEDYSAHGAKVTIPEPTDTISLDELQSRLQSIE